MKSKIKIGRYDFGCRKVDVYVSPKDSGGEFNSAPDSGVAELIIGIDYDDWSRVVSVAMHEALELACAEMNIRYRPSPDYSGDSGSFLFVMDHAQFSEAVARAAYLLSHALPQLAKAYEKSRSGK